MGFQPIRKILPHALQSAGIAQQVTAARVIQIAQDTFLRLWGEEKAACLYIGSFQDGILTIRSTSPAAQQEIRVHQVRLQNEMNRVLGARRILSIRCFTE